MRGPRRLIEEEAASELGSALRQARAATGGDEQVARLWQKVATQAGAAPALEAAPELARLSAVKSTAVLTLVGVAALGVVAYVLGGESDRAPARTRTEAVDVPPPAAAAVPAPISTSSTPGDRGIAAAEPTDPPARAREARGGRTPRARSVQSGAIVDPEAELALLTRAEQALERTPAAALAILDEHARRFPDGVLAQEREVLSIDAQLALGRKPAAAARARAFLARFPSSAHRHRFAPLLHGDHKMESQPIPTDRTPSEEK